MTWEIKIPFQDRSQTIAEALGAGLDHTALEPGEDRDVTTQILLRSSFGTMGELIDHIEALDADGRRELLDKARTAAGLDTVEDAEGHAAFISANRAAMLSRGSRPRFTDRPRDDARGPAPLVRRTAGRQRTARAPDPAPSRRAQARGGGAAQPCPEGGTPATRRGFRSAGDAVIVRSLAEARWEINHRLAIEHESAHAAAAVLLGLAVTEIRVDWPDDCQGRVRLRRRRTQRREFALLVMAAFLCDPRKPPFPPFPPLPLEDETPDEEQLREVVEEMDLDRPAWKRLCQEAAELVARDDFNRLQEALKTALAHRPLLEGKLLAGIVAIGTTERYGTESPKEVAWST